MPAYRASRTLRATHEAIPHDIVDMVILTDDASDDGTAEMSRELGIVTIVHDKNQGYGGNQKTCYAAALDAGADIVVMLHPDYQYEPRLVTAMASMVASGVYDMVLASRILGGTAREGGMPAWKYVANRALTFFENLALGSKLSEFHTGFRGYSRSAILNLPLLANSDDFVFDNQLLAQAVARKLRIGEISCPTSYHADSSSIGFRRSVRYGLGVLATSGQFVAWRLGLWTPKIFRFEAEDFLGRASRLADKAP
ncbi:MAG: glycosyltransferase family 2 protein [Usitatibacter sp.]